MQIREPIQIEQAVKLVMEHRFQGQKEKLSLVESDERRLAEPIIATNDVPSFDKSPYDGFAFIAKDTEHADGDNPITFEIIEHIGAGVLPDKRIKSGQATRIMTGAKIADGADCVAMLEDCQTFEENGKRYMTIGQQMDEDQNIIESDQK